MPAEHVQVSTQHEKVSTQHVHVPAEDDGMTAEHVEGPAEEKITGGAMDRIWQEKPVHARQRPTCLLCFLQKNPTPTNPSQLYAAAL